jgi:hypothetical protein
MASIISAGTTSGTSLNLSGDTSGVLQLASNGSTTAVTITTAQDVGIGTASPSSKLDVSSATGNTTLTVTNTTGTLQLQQNSNDGYINMTGTGNIVFRSSVSYVERMRLPSAGGLQVVNCVSVGNATPAASGAGITFPASQSASSDANTLDDYEEGTWTPTVSYSTSDGDLSYVAQVGTYAKVGRQVTCLLRLRWSETTASGNISVTGLPFTSANNSQIQAGAAVLDDMTSVTGGGAWYLIANSTSPAIYSIGTGSMGSITNTNTSGTGSAIHAVITYFV